MKDKQGRFNLDELLNVDSKTAVEAGDKEAVDFWKWCLDLSLQYFAGLYRRFK